MAKLINTPEGFENALRSLESSDTLVVDTETTGLRMYARDNPARMCGIVVGPADALDTDRDYYFSFRHGEGSNLDPDKFLPPLRRLFAGKRQLFHNAAFDIKILSCDGFEQPPTILDTIVAAHLCNELEDSFALKELGLKYFGADQVSEDAALKEELKKRKYDKGDMWRLPAEMVSPYALADVRLTRMLYVNRLAELKRWTLEDLFHERCAFLQQLVRSEMHGIYLDVAEVQDQIAMLAPAIERYHRRLKELAGPDVNFNSPKQLCKWLGLGSTEKQLLEDILAKTPREDIQTLLDYRALTKAKSTYFEPFLELVDLAGRIHTSYKIHGTLTHRLSSSEPNLQNTSRDQERRIYSVRSCLAAPFGSFLIDADYSSIEPRLAAHFSRDPGLIEVFRRGHDFHRATAKSIYKTHDVSKDQRQDAKVAGLSILYGIGGHKLSQRLGLRHHRDELGEFAPHYEAVWGHENGELVEMDCSVLDKEFCTAAGRQFIKKYYAAIPELEPTVRAVRAKARENLYIRNPLTGACQRFHPVKRNPHKAFNALIQNSASEVLRRAFTKLGQMFNRPEDPRIVLTVHDSIVFEVDFGKRAADYAKVIKDVMENTTQIEVPLEVEMKMGPNLGNTGVLDVKALEKLSA